MTISIDQQNPDDSGKHAFGIGGGEPGTFDPGGDGFGFALPNEPGVWGPIGRVAAVPFAALDGPTPPTIMSADFAIGM